MTADFPPIEGWDTSQIDPPWAEGLMPDVHNYQSSEAFVAGAISTMPPFTSFHPAWCLPIAWQALDALSEWEPNE